MKAAEFRKRRITLVAISVAAMLIMLLLRQKPATEQEAPVISEKPTSAKVQPFVKYPFSAQQTNRLGDLLITPHDAEFVSKVFPKFRQFVATLDQLNINPFEGELRPEACSKIRIIPVPNGMTCPFVIGDSWTAEYTQVGSFEGITHFGQRGPDNPFRAISRSDSEALNRLSQRAVIMPEAEARRIAAKVADAFGINQSQFEAPRMHEEALFDYRLGLHTVRYLKKGSDPLNQMNYTRSFTLKATSPTTAVLIR